jgi:hypothetical protein
MKREGETQKSINTHTHTHTHSMHARAHTKIHGHTHPHAHTRHSRCTSRPAPSKSNGDGPIGSYIDGTRDGDVTVLDRDPRPRVCSAAAMSCAVLEGTRATRAPEVIRPSGAFLVESTDDEELMVRMNEKGWSGCGPPAMFVCMYVFVNVYTRLGYLHANHVETAG